MSEANETTIYLLEMDSTLNLSTCDTTQVYPLQVIDNNTAISYNKLFLPIQAEAGHSDQVEVSYVCPEPPQKQNNSQLVQNKYFSTCHTLHQSSPILHIMPKELPGLVNDIESSRTVLISPLLDGSEKPIASYCKKPIQNFVHIPDRTVIPRAIAVLPTVLQIRQKNMISARRTLLPRTRFGPIQGTKHNLSLDGHELFLNAETNKMPLFICRDGEQLVHIDTSDKDKANWIGLLPLGDENTANVWIYEENKELYIITAEQVPPRKQLMLGYSTKYAQEYGLMAPTKDIDIGFPLHPKTWWCYECQRALPSAYQLQRHMNSHKQTIKLVKRRRPYRCRYCTRTFTRIFTLRRHVSRNCEKKPVKSDSKSSTVALPESMLNTSLNSEDNRVPSDESFQNYTNGLDFSTNLFDTDRMPGLDISGNSRSEDFNPFGLANENALSNDLVYNNESPKKTSVLVGDDNQKDHQVSKAETFQASCNSCNQIVTRGRKRQHASECPAKRFECECKKVFTSKELLAIHFYSEHSNKEVEIKEQNESENASNCEVQDNKTFVCELCQCAFKRRGMLVNHLWRVHDTVSARVPLEKRDLHFPCGICPKMYRSSTKRDRHVQLHHPGAGNVRAREIVGGTRPCSPAKCSECPRQYTTRAKLLQHQRQHHPHMVHTNPKKTNVAQHNWKIVNPNITSEESLRSKTSLQQLLNFY